MRGNSAHDLLLRADCRTSGNVSAVQGAGQAIVTEVTTMLVEATMAGSRIFACRDRADCGASVCQWVGGVRDTGADVCVGAAVWRHPLRAGVSTLGAGDRAVRGALVSIGMVGVLWLAELQKRAALNA